MGESSGGDGGDAPELPDPLSGYTYRPGRRGPATTLTPAMIPLIANSYARYGVKRKAAADGGTTEDCLDVWLRRGLDALNRKKRNLYTELLVAFNDAWAHRFGFLIELGERTVVDRHCNPRFITWLMGVTSPKQFTIPKEATAAQHAGQLGPAFELVTPEQAAASLEEKARKFLELEDKRAVIVAEVTAGAVEAASPAPESGPSGGA